MNKKKKLKCVHCLMYAESNILFVDFSISFEMSKFIGGEFPLESD